MLDKDALGREQYLSFPRITELTWDPKCHHGTPVRVQTRESGSKWNPRSGPAHSEAPGSMEALVVICLEHKYNWEQRHLVFDRICPLVPLPGGKKYGSRADPFPHKMIDHKQDRISCWDRMQNPERRRMRGCSPCQSPHSIHHLTPQKPDEPQRRTEDLHKGNQVAAPLQLRCQMWHFWLKKIHTVSGLGKEVLIWGMCSLPSPRKGEGQKQFRFT